MRILHVFSAEFFAGSVAYARALAAVQSGQGHQVWLASDAAALPGLPAGVRVVRVPVSQRRYGQRLRHVRALRRLVGQEQIDVVHAHSRAASWVSYFALRGLPVPLVSTVHGRQHLHASVSLFDIYGEAVIAICANLAAHLRDEVGLRAGKVAVIPNGVEFGGASGHLTPLAPLSKREGGTSPSSSSSSGNSLELGLETSSPSLLERGLGGEVRLALITRFNGPKGALAAALLQHVFPALLAECPELKIALIGGELDQLPDAGKVALAQLEADFGVRVEVVGFTADVAGWLDKSDLVIGAGRVAIEALGAGRAVLALGEALYAGPITPDTYAAAAASNFGDILAELPEKPFAFDPAPLLADARAWLQNPAPPPAALAARVRADYDLAGVAARVMRVYEGARMRRARPRWLPVLMYHKVPDRPLASRHRIFVTKDNFARHLTFFRRLGCTPITFHDYHDFAQARRPLSEFPSRPLILTFDDGYLDNYTNALPLMRQYGFRGVLYLLGDPSMRANDWDLATDPAEPRAELMRPEQQAAFVAAGWEIGAHTLTHPRLPDLPPAEAAREIAAGKPALEARLGVNIISFAYPFGALTDELKQQVAAAGYAYAVATDTGPAHLEDDRLHIFRVNVFPEDTAFSLLKKTAAWYRAYRARKQHQ